MKLKLNEIVLTPAPKARNVKELVIWEEQNRPNKILVQLKDEPNPKDHEYLKPQPLDARTDLRVYQTYTKASGYLFSPHR